MLEKTLESPLDCLEGLMAEAETPILWPPDAKNWHWKRPWCWERLRAGGEAEDRGWDGWIASPTQWTWVWASSESWWWTGRPGMLQSMGLQRVRHDWATELNWTELKTSDSPISNLPPQFPGTESSPWCSAEINFLFCLVESWVWPLDSFIV